MLVGEVNIDFTQILNYGVLGIVVLALIFGYLWAKPAVDDLKARAEKAEAQRDEALKLWQDNVIPLLQDFNEATKSLIPILQQLVGQQLQQRRSSGGRRTP